MTMNDVCRQIWSRHRNQELSNIQVIQVTNTEESRITPELQKFSGHALTSRDCPRRIALADHRLDEPTRNLMIRTR